MKRFTKKASLVLACTLMAGTMLTGCGNGSKKQDYDVYLYNTKLEIADSVQEMAASYEDETGKKVKVYTCGTAENMETLRSEMSSKSMPTLYAINQAQFKEWNEGGFVVAASEIQDPELKAIYDSVPANMCLQNENGENCGIPYNVEGYGMIADLRMMADVFGLDDTAAFVEDYKAATYAEFEKFVVALDDYIHDKGGEAVTLNGKIYITAEDKTAVTENVNGVFSIAAAEKWTYANHYINYPVNAVFADFASVANAASDQIDRVEEPLVKALQELEFVTQFSAGPNGAVTRGAEYINSTATGYDQAVQTFAEGKAFFIKQGNWIFSNVASIDEEKANNLTFLPVKVNFGASDIAAEGMTVEKMNASIPEFVSQNYVINKKATDEQKAEAEAFVKWIYTSATGQDYIINKFNFVPFNADSTTPNDNPLSTSLITYLRDGNVLCNGFDAVPANWGINTIGAFIQEKLFTTSDELDEATLREAAIDALQNWKDSVSK